MVKTSSEKFTSTKCYRFEFQLDNLLKSQSSWYCSPCSHTLIQHICGQGAELQVVYLTLLALFPIKWEKLFYLSYSREKKGSILFLWYSQLNKKTITNYDYGMISPFYRYLFMNQIDLSLLYCDRRPDLVKDLWIHNNSRIFSLVPN